MAKQDRCNPHIIDINIILGISKEELISHPIGYLRALLRERILNANDADHLDYQVLDNLLSKTRRKAQKNKYADNHKQKYESEMSCLSTNIWSLVEERDILLQTKFELMYEIDNYRTTIDFLMAANHN
ncbi:hypothetical protein LOD99_8082 [Oopsacas minuta]|uniref:BZIP domain-containing protein n=1 Tax=Oopsacas minuta TaxID=111878 RepID=A0AAV7JHV0_9METZ|nr:hypothetical protein LOD99_8082 [Oopsacas minuta]